MSDVMINDSVSLKKRWNELVQYNIFLLKFVEFGIGFFVLLLPSILPRPRGHMYCMAAGPTVVISLIFIILYLREKVLGLLLALLPSIVKPVDFLGCLVGAPTLMLSIYFMVLYMAGQQNQYTAELYYLVVELFITLLAYVNLVSKNKWLGLYPLFYFIIFWVFLIDLVITIRERGKMF